MNEEFPVGAGQQPASITSLPFVHTARRYYRSNGPVRSSDLADDADRRAAFRRGAIRRSTPGEDDRTRSFRGSKSRNKVSVGEPAEGSLPSCIPTLHTDQKGGTSPKTMSDLGRQGNIPPMARRELADSIRVSSLRPFRATRVKRLRRGRSDGDCRTTVPCICDDESAYTPRASRT